MASQSPPSNSTAAILRRVIYPGAPALPPDAARAFLAFDFESNDQQRMQELARKAQKGSLSEDERAEAENYNQAGHILALLQAWAQRSLKQAGDSA